MASDEIFFGSLKENRGWYFVEYPPPRPNFRYSTLQLTVVEPRETADVVVAMESEAREWLRRYPIPLMATAFSADDSVFSLQGIRSTNHLMAWAESKSQDFILRWDLLTSDALPAIALDRKWLRAAMRHVPHKTGSEIQREVADRVALQRAEWWLVFLWAVVVPLLPLQRWSGGVTYSASWYWATHS